MQGDNRYDGRSLAADVLCALGVLTPSSGDGNGSSGVVSTGSISSASVSSSSGGNDRHKENMVHWDKELRQPTSWDALFGPPIKEETLANMFF